MLNLIKKLLKAGTLPEGIDVSHYQGHIKWDDVSKAPLSYAYIKATEGANYKDKFYDYNINEARRIGLNVGSYHFYRPNISPKALFDNMQKNIKIENQDLVPIIDIEYRGNSPKLNFVSNLQNFIDMVENHYGKKPMIYTYHDFYNQHLLGEFKDYPLMIADYRENNPTLKDNRKYSALQYSSKGYIPGIKGHVDLSRILNNYNNLKLYPSMVYIDDEGKPVVAALDYPRWLRNTYYNSRILDQSGKPVKIFGTDVSNKPARDLWQLVATELYPEGGPVDVDYVNAEIERRNKNYKRYIDLKTKEWSYPSPPTIKYEPDWRVRARNRRLADRQRDNLIVYDDYTKQFRNVDGYDVANGIGDIILSPLGMVLPQEGRNYEDIENLKILTPLGLIALDLTDDPRKVSAVSIVSGIPTYASAPYYGAIAPTIAMMPSTFYGMFKSFKDATKEEGFSKSASGKSIKSFTFKRPKNEKSN